MRELVSSEVQEVGGGKDCTYASLTYSKGATIKGADGPAGMYRRRQGNLEVGNHSLTSQP